MRIIVNLLLMLVLCFAVSCENRRQAKGKDSNVKDEDSTNEVVEWLDSIVIAKVDLRGVTVNEAVDYAWRRSKIYGVLNDESTKGISIIVSLAQADSGLANGDALAAVAIHNNQMVDLARVDIPFLDLIAEIARQGQLDAYLTSVGIFLVPERKSPFPNCKAEDGEVWRVLRKASE